MSKGWSRGDLLALVGIPIAVIGIIIGITIPELRRCLRLESGTCPIFKDDQPPLNLRTGVYNAEGTMFRGSYREVINIDGRVCINFVDAPPYKYEGNIKTYISSVSWREGSFYIDATGKPLLFNDDNSFDDGKIRGSWKLFNLEVKKSQEMDECLSSHEKYTRRIYGGYKPGEFRQH